MRKLLLIVSALTLSFNSCKKEVVETVSLSKGDTQASFSKTYENTNNLLDSIGFWHNVMQDSTLSLTFPEEESEAEDSIIKHGSYYGVILWGDTMDCDTLQLIPGYVGLYSNIDFLEQNASVMNAIGLSQEKADKISSYIDDCEAMIDTLDSTATMTQVNSYLISIENEYIDFAGGNFTEFYFSSAIYRYSFIRDWSENTDYSNARKKNKKKKVAAADVVGAVVGYIVGGNVITALVGANAASGIANKLIPADEPE